MDRLLLLLPTTTYRTEDFLDAARTLGVDIVCASEKPSTFEAHVPDHLLTLDFADPDGAAARVAELAERRPLHAVVGVDDLTTVAAAAIAERLGLRANAVAAVAAARDKYQMRQCLAAAGVPIPRFRRIALKDDPFLAARGVAVSLRAQAAGAVGQPRRDPRQQRRPVHGGLPAHRRAARARRRRGQRATPPGTCSPRSTSRASRWRWRGCWSAATLHTLALFDKPDPLEGPFFEETHLRHAVAAARAPSRTPSSARRRRRARRSASPRGRCTPSCA